MENSINSDCQFDITIKNFGELPASKVSAIFVLSKTILDREELKSQKKKQSFDLGPMLQNMDKHYWFFIPIEVWKKAEEGQEKIFIGLSFRYPASGNNSGYGIISEYNASTHNFMHRDMWIDDVTLQ